MIRIWPRERLWRWLVLALAISAPLLSRPGLIGGDEPHYAVMAWSLAFDGDLRLENDYEAVARDGSPAAGRRNAGKELDRHLLRRAAGLVPSHPIGLPLMVAPLLRLAAAAGVGRLPDAVLLGWSLLWTLLGYLAVAAVLGRWLGDRKAGRVLAAVTFFSSPLWFYGRTFFTEPYLWSFAAVALWLLVRDRPLAAGLLLGASILIKEPALLLVAVVVAGVFWLRGPSVGLRVSIGPALGIAGFLMRNVLLYGEAPVTFFQPFQRGDPLRGLLGVLFDPRHGLLPFFPLAVLGLYGLVRARGAVDRKLALLAGAAIVAQLGLVASWTDWTGGSCYGPRLLVPILPALGVGVAIAWKQSGGTISRTLLIALAALGFGVQAVAVTSPFRAFWSIRLDELLFAKTGAWAIAALAAAAFGFWLARALPPPSREPGQGATPDQASVAPMSKPSAKT